MQNNHVVSENARPNPGTSNTLTLPDKRKLGFSVFGSPDWKKILIYFHGFPGSRLEASPSSEAAKKLGITVLAFDRPGIGSSDFLSYKAFHEFAIDLEAALNELKISRATILAVSGGTPYALAAAIHLKDKIERLAIVSGVGDFTKLGSLSGMNRGNRMFVGVCRKSKKVGVLLVRGMATVWRKIPSSAGLWFGLVLPKTDLKIIRRPEIGSALARGMREALRPGTRGAVAEFSRMMAPWDLNLDNLKIPLKIWHGESDTYVPASSGKALKNSVSQAELELVPEGGHFMVFDMMDKVLEWCGGKSE